MVLESAPSPVPVAVRRSNAWPYFSTPLRVFAGVIGPIAGMMLALAILPGVPPGIRVTAGLVVAISAVCFYRGYARRVELTPVGVCFRCPGRTWLLAWSEIRHVGRYIPLDRNRTTQYVYITRLDAPPVDWRELDVNTIQLQDRPGLLEQIQSAWDQHKQEARR